MGDSGGQESVSQWLQSLRAECQNEAAERLWERYFDQLVRLAKQKLGERPLGGLDAEDVALSVFDTLVRGVREGRFPRLQDRMDLWGLLLALTQNKAIDVRRHEGRQKRGGGAVRREAELEAAGGGAFSLDAMCGTLPTPEFLVELNDVYAHVQALLRDDVLRKIATSILSGYTVEEMSTQLGVSSRTIQRKLELIRATWWHELVLR